PGERLVVHGNNKSDEELRATAEARVAYVVLDSVEELDRARAAGAGRLLVRITPGIEADTHEAIRTGHLGSKFGVTPDEAAAIAPGKRSTAARRTTRGRSSTTPGTPPSSRRACMRTRPTPSASQASTASPATC